MKRLSIIALSAVLFSGCTIQNLFIKKPAGLEITTSPSATVFIDGDNVGVTPYENQSVNPGKYTLKLTPLDGSLQEWETKLDLDPQVTTIINRTFAGNETEAIGYILQLKPDSDKNTAYISVISDPDTANVSLDGTPLGFTPMSKQSIREGSHTIEVASPGFKPITITITATAGYNLVVDAKLAREIIRIEQKEATPSADLEESESEGASPSPSPVVEEELERPYVVIEETGTGWLRVRDAPNTVDAEEIGKVNVGEKLPFIESNETGWYKVIFESEEGWISGKYATLYE